MDNSHSQRHDPGMREWVRGMSDPPEGWGCYLLVQTLLDVLVSVLWP